MARQKKEHYVVLTPKNDDARKRLSYHGERWILRDTIDKLKFSMEPGPFFLLVSKDGKKCLHVKKEYDTDFNVRVV